jgi:hypothetical protein
MESKHIDWQMKILCAIRFVYRVQPQTWYVI